jgi:hypothetical protein
MDVRPGGLRELLPVSDLIQLDFSIGMESAEPGNAKNAASEIEPSLNGIELAPRSAAGSNSLSTLGLEPRTYGLKVRCSTN